MRTQDFKEAEHIYCYDGTFDGFLSCVFMSFLNKERPLDIWDAAQERLSLYPILAVETNLAHAQRVFRSIDIKITPYAKQLVTTCFLSGAEGKEYILLRFLHMGFQEGKRVVNLLGDPIVSQVMALHKNITHEAHQYKGFIRFEESEGMLGAVIAPKNYVLPLLQGHFCSRFPEESFLIYDETHQAVLLYQNHQAEILQLAAPLQLPKPDQKESYYQALWKQFYSAIEIKSRHNERCRQTLCPKRYWAHMTELKEELEGRASPAAAPYLLE